MKNKPCLILGICALILNVVSCSNHSRSREIIKEQGKIQNHDDSKSLLDIMDSIAASIVAKHEIKILMIYHIMKEMRM